MSDITKSNCQFIKLGENEVHDMKMYITKLMEGGLIDENTKITQLIRIIHPDSNSGNKIDMSPSVRDCATRLFNGYKNYLDSIAGDNSNERTVGYILSLQDDKIKINEQLASLYTEGSLMTEAENIREITSKILISNPMILSNVLLENAIFLANVIFKVDFNTFDSNLDINRGEELPYILFPSNKQQTTIQENIQTYKTYITALILIEFVLNYSYLLQDRKFTSISNLQGRRILTRNTYGGSKKKSYKRQRSKKGKPSRTCKRKTPKRKTTQRGSGPGFVKNLERTGILNNLLSRKLAYLSKGMNDNELSNTLKTPDYDIDLIVSNERKMNAMRTQFYSLYDQWVDESKRGDEYNLQSGILGSIGLNRKRVYRDYNDYPQLVTRSFYEKKLREFWISQRKSVEEMATLNELRETLGESERMLDSERDDPLYDKKYTQRELLAANRRLNKLKGEYEDGLSLVKDTCNVMNLTQKYIGFVISEEHLGKKRVDEFIKLIISKIEDRYLTNIDKMVGIKSFSSITIEMLKRRLTMPQQIMGVEEFANLETLEGVNVPYDVMIEETNKASYEINKIMSSVISDVNNKIRRDMLEKSIKAEQAIATSNYEYSIDPNHAKLVDNMSSIAIAGFYIVKDYDYISLTRILSIQIPSLNSFVSSLAPSETLTPEFIQTIPLYIQMISLAYIIPIIINKNYRGGIFSDEQLQYVKSFIVYLLLIAILVPVFFNLYPGQYFEYSQEPKFNQQPPLDQQPNTETGTPTMASWAYRSTIGVASTIISETTGASEYSKFTHINWWAWAATELSKTIANNTALRATHNAQSILLDNPLANSFILGNLLGIILFSSISMASDYKQLMSISDKSFRQLDVELKDLVYGEGTSDLEKYLDDFDKATDKQLGSDYDKKYVDAVTNAYNTIVTQQIQTMSQLQSARAQSAMYELQVKGLSKTQTTTQGMRKQLPGYESDSDLM